ncbi:MAG: head-tail connector protein [Defluviitaleaceae bacterium]|nr:head-tail connector protein [Defluviitaleaceae bacterium]MCL2263962.1 head-tail connector protein [Defluviitaleaceae bacterium]
MPDDASTPATNCDKKKRSNLDELKEYLRVDHDHDDAQLKMLMCAAKEYLKNAGVAVCNTPLYRLAVMLYVAVHYENRDGAQKMDGFSHALQSIILQLKAA